MGGVVEERRRVGEEVIRKTCEFVSCVKRVFGCITAVLFGSYARGDFNEWSDVDVLIVVNKDLPVKPTKRLDLIEKCMTLFSLIEPVIVTKSEFIEMIKKNNPVVIDAKIHGIIIIDELGIGSLIGRKEDREYSSPCSHE